MILKDETQGTFHLCNFMALDSKIWFVLREEMDIFGLIGGAINRKQ